MVLVPIDRMTSNTGAIVLVHTDRMTSNTGAMVLVPIDRMMSNTGAMVLVPIDRMTSNAGAMVLVHTDRMTSNAGAMVLVPIDRMTSNAGAMVLVPIAKTTGSTAATESKTMLTAEVVRDVVIAAVMSNGPSKEEVATTAPIKTATAIRSKSIKALPAEMPNQADTTKAKFRFPSSKVRW